MRTEVIVIIAVIVVTIIGVGVALLTKKHTQSPVQTKEYDLPVLKSQDSNLIAFQSIDALTPEEENRLIPVKGKMVVQRVVDAIPKTGQVAVNAANAAKAADLVNNGIYRAIIPQGAVLDKSRAMEGAFRGSYREVANSIQGNANWVPVDRSVGQLQAASVANAAMGAASMVVGQYYMSQISSQLETVNSNISAITQHLDDDYYSEVKQVVADVKNISEFKVEIFENEKEKDRILGKLLDLESQSEKLLNHANKHLQDLSKTQPYDYDNYETHVREAFTWYQYQSVLVETLNAIAELRYTFGNGSLTKEYTHSKYYSFAEQSIEARGDLESWHLKNVEKFGIDPELAHRDRKGLNAAAWWIPGLFKDDLNYKRINENVAETIRNQTENQAYSAMILDDPYTRDIVLIEKDGELYYMPEKNTVEDAKYE